MGLIVVVLLIVFLAYWKAYDIYYGN